MKILLIEDDAQLVKVLKAFLNMKEFNVDVCMDGEDAILKVDSCTCDLFIIDINLPKINGLEVVKYIRQKDFSTPIIMITASMEIKSFETAYKNGCNEYIKKPFHIRELDIIIDKLLKNKNKKIINISENIFYDADVCDLYINNQYIPLRKKESRLLNILLENANQTVKNEAIMNYVWENEIKESYSIRQVVKELRKEFPNGGEYIKTSVGIGYRFEIPN